MVPDWKALLPHRPLDPDSDQYVAPPTGGAERIAEWILADRTTVLVAGPVGIGKSTELARATRLMHAERTACLIRLDRLENMRRATTDQLLLRTAGELAYQTIGQFHIHLSSPLRATLGHAGVLTHEATDSTGQKVPTFTGSALTTLKLTLSEISSARNQRIVLILDGLEKMPDGPNTLEFFESLGLLSDAVDIVAVLPWSLAFGVGTNAAIRVDEHIVVLRAPDVTQSDAPGPEFLLELLARRLSIPSPPEARAVFEEAIRCSGGIPRTFLQLVADSGTYARIRRKAPWPDFFDIRDAILEQQESFRRLLRPGDSAAIRAAITTDGRELELERRVRLLTHGVLLERDLGNMTILELHPLLAGLLHA
jgi:hypothetical protein